MEKQDTSALLAQIDELKKLLSEKEDQLKQSQKLELVGQLAGGIAHDFNNILTSIIGFSDLARTYVKDDLIVKNYLSSIISKSDQAANLVQQLMAFSRQQKLSLRTHSVSELISQSIDFTKKTIPENIELICDELGFYSNIEADSNAFQQILTNLLFNSIYAIGSKNGFISLSFVKKDSIKKINHDIVNKKYVCIEIKDNGIGMDKETLQKVFEPFFTTKPVGQGSGLGLSMVYGLMEQHDGFIEIRSEINKGTTIDLFFPVSENEISQKNIIIGKPKNGNNNKILIVDDDLELLTILKAIFDSIDYNTVIANNATDALRIIKQERDNLSLVISDIVMPEMNGIKLIQSIQEMNLNIKCILMSGYPDKVFKEEGIELKKIPFLRKPFTLEQASDLIMRILL